CGLVPKEYEETRRFDAQEIDTAAVVDWLRAQGIGDEPVKVYWLSDREGISIRLNDFLEFFDELWFPSSDDIVVESQSKMFVIGIDDEEQVQLFLRGQENVSGSNGRDLSLS